MKKYAALFCRGDSAYKKRNQWEVFDADRDARTFSGGIPCVWGMEAMVILVDEGRLSPARAMRVAEGIARSNRFITQSILDGFRKRIGLRS